MHSETVENITCDFAHHIDLIRKYYLDGYLLEDEIRSEQSNLKPGIEILRPGIEIALPTVTTSTVEFIEKPQYLPEPLLPNVHKQWNRVKYSPTPPEVRKPTHYSQLTEEDIKKIKEFSVPHNDPSITIQDIQFIQCMIENPDETDIFEIARLTNPDQRETEVEYLKKRYKTLNYFFLHHLSLKLEMKNEEDENLISLNNPTNIDLEHFYNQLSRIGEKGIKDRRTKHLHTKFSHNGKNTLISAVSVDGKWLKPLPLLDVKLVELPKNATIDASGNGTVLIIGENNHQEIQKVNTTYTEAKIENQARLINLFFAEGSMSRQTLYTKLSTGEEPMSSRAEQLLIYTVNKLMRSWGVEIAYDESGSVFCLQLAGEKEPELPQPIEVSYEEDSAFYEDRIRKRKPSHANMRL
ncbi:MAG: hypothetical protein Q7T54_05755 [Candidatus Levybacteria bacterium]|nr:hypothetical protein [Candidatus Levybacteria bacterium]